MWDDPKFLRALLDNLYDGIYFVDRERIITFWNKGAERLSGFTAKEVVGRGCRENILIHVDAKGCQLCTDGCPLAATIADGQERQAEVFMHHKAGHRMPVAVKSMPIHDRDGQIVGAVETFSDNSARTADQEKIEELQTLAFLDPLTTLANRRYLEIAIRARLEELTRYGWPFGILFFDIDHFKLVNDNYGHEVGDRVLTMVAKTLGNSSRSSDLVGRWGGEEFLAVIANIGSDHLRGAAERYRQMIEHSGLNIDGKLLQVTASIGASWALPGDSVESIVQRADALMYQSKLAGRNRVSSDR